MRMKAITARTEVAKTKTEDRGDVEEVEATTIITKPKAQTLIRKNTLKSHEMLNIYTYITKLNKNIKVYS